LYIKEKQKLGETDEYLGNLHQNFKESIETIKDASKGLENSIQKLTEFAEIYQETGVDDLEDREKYRLVIENLKIRNDKVQKLIGALRTFNQMHDIVKKLDQTVSSVKNTLDNDFQNLNDDLSQ
jgi:F0F1-type ATP synthase beta subunit